MRNTLRALICASALTMLAACSATQLDTWLPAFEPGAAILCDELARGETQDTRDHIRIAMQSLKATLDSGETPDLSLFVASYLADLRPAQQKAIADILTRLKTRVDAELPIPDQARMFAGLVGQCAVGLQAPEVALLDAVDTALRWLASPAAALSASEIDIAGDLAVLCNGQGNALSLVRLDGNQTGTEVKTITARGKPRTCVVAGEYVVTSEIVAGNPATLDLAVYAVPTLVETDRIPGAGLPVVLRPSAGESLIYAQGSTRRCRYGLAAGELTEQLCRVPSATGIAPVLTPTLLATFLSTTAELWNLPAMTTAVSVPTGVTVSRSSSDGESIVANGRDLMLIEAGVVRSRVASVWATLGVLITDGAVYLARGATGTQPNRVDVYAIDPVSRAMTLARTVPTSLANDLARGPDGVYQSDASLGILRVERIGAPPTTAPTFPPPTRTNTQAVALSTATHTNTPGEGVLRACIEACLAE